VGTREAIERALAKGGLNLQRTTMVLGSTEAIERAVGARMGVRPYAGRSLRGELCWRDRKNARAVDL
jgi:hypothetical protein